MKVLVLAARGLQAAYVGCYGNPWIATPNLDALAAEGVVFDRHFADRADAAGAWLTWRDGRHHLPDPSRPESTSEGNADLIDRLRNAGVYTCLVRDSGRPAEPGFEAGWDEIQPAPSFDAVLEAAAAAVERLSERESWLLWVDLAPLTPPWDTPEEFVAPYFVEEPDDEEEYEDETEDDIEEEAEPLTPLTDPAAGPIDPEDDLLFAAIAEQLRRRRHAARRRHRPAAGTTRRRQPGRRRFDCLHRRPGQQLGEHGVVGPFPATTHQEATHLPQDERQVGCLLMGRRREGADDAVLAQLLPTVGGAASKRRRPGCRRPVVPAAGRRPRRAA